MIERHGDKPVVVACASAEQEMRRLQKQVEGFARRDLRTMGVICKTQERAKRLHEALAAHSPDVHLLTEDSKQFVDGVIVCATYLAKGLEFDRVVVPHATTGEYHSAMDRNLLYVACTRAMHELVITHTGRLTGFIADPALYDTEAAGAPA